LTAATADQQKANLKKTRIARLLLPQIDANSALLPPDKWIIRTAYDFIKGNKSLHDTIIRTLSYAGGGLGAVIGGVVGAVVLFPAALPMAAVGIAALGVAAFAGFRAKHHFGRFMKETLPQLRTEVGKKYLDYKVSELKAAWQRNLEERRKKKAEAGTKPKAEQPAEKKPEEAKPAEKKPEVVKTPDATATPEKPKAEKKSLGKAFGELAQKLAEERAKKALQQKQGKEAKKDAPENKTDDAPKAEPAQPKPPEQKPPAPPQP
jgi:hypothetical protein